MALRIKSRSSLFLIEMIVVILVFAVASAICVSLFVQARLTSLRSAQLTMSVNRCQNAVECLRGVGDDPQALEALLGAAQGEDGIYRVFYDGDWALTGADAARYTLAIRVTPKGEDLLAAVVSVTEGDGASPIYALETTQYRPQGG